MKIALLFPARGARRVIARAVAAGAARRSGSAEARSSAQLGARCCSGGAARSARVRGSARAVASGKRLLTRLLSRQPPSVAASQSPPPMPHILAPSSHKAATRRFLRPSCFLRPSHAIQPPAFSSFMRKFSKRAAQRRQLQASQPSCRRRVSAAADTGYAFFASCRSAALR